MSEETRHLRRNAIVRVSISPVTPLRPFFLPYFLTAFFFSVINSFLVLFLSRLFSLMSNPSPLFSPSRSFRADHRTSLFCSQLPRGPRHRPHEEPRQRHCHDSAHHGPSEALGCEGRRQSPGFVLAGEGMRTLAAALMMSAAVRCPSYTLPLPILRPV